MKSENKVRQLRNEEYQEITIEKLRFKERKDNEEQDKYPDGQIKRWK